MKKIALFAAAATAVLFAAPASAQSSFSTFEGDVPGGTPSGPGFVNVGSASGWTGGPGGIELQYNNVAGAPATNGGSVFVELDTTGNSYMQRALAAGNYNLSFLYSPRPNVGAGSNGIQVSLFNNLTNSFNILGSFTGNGGANTAWNTATVPTFTIGANQFLRFDAIGTSDSLGGYVDNINIAAVPETATWGMMILGFGVVGGAMRRRRSTATLATA